MLLCKRNNQDNMRAHTHKNRTNLISFEAVTAWRKWEERKIIVKRMGERQDVNKQERKKLYERREKLSAAKTWHLTKPLSALFSV